MGKYKPNHNGPEYGSQLNIQRLTSSASHSSLFAQALGSQKIKWLSPVAEDQYSEYRDEFPELGISPKSLKEFWPSGGPQWDGIAIDETNNRYLLIEAKAHLSELFNKMTAKDEQSIGDITLRLKELATSLHVKSFNNEYWLDSLYQTANRLAFLKFLNEHAEAKWKGRVHLVYLIFLNDPISNKYSMGLNETADAWSTALFFAEHKMLNIPVRNRLAKYTHTVFLDSLCR